MKTITILAIGALIGAAAFGGPILTPIDAKASFLTADLGNSNPMLPDAPANAVFIDITAFQNQMINILPIGGLCFTGTSLAPSGANICNAPGGGAAIPEGILLGGVFTSDNTLLGLGVAQRLPTAIATVLPSFATTMFFSGTSNTNPFDFVLTNGTGLNVVVPATAHFLVVGVFDSFFKDNTDPDHSLAVQITGPAVVMPEPATYAMLLTGLGGLLAFGRHRARRG
jgi:hypothetical protein